MGKALAGLRVEQQRLGKIRLEAIALAGFHVRIARQRGVELFAAHLEQGERRRSGRFRHLDHPVEHPAVTQTGIISSPAFTAKPVLLGTRVPAIRFIAGDPMKVATNVLDGLS